MGENLIDPSWFDFNVDYIGKTTPYTGKALKPKVTKGQSAPADLKFKTTYFNNKDAGTASIVVSGTGKYAGEETFEFEIQSLPITEGNVITANIKATQNIAYTGGVKQVWIMILFIKLTKKKRLQHLNKQAPILL